MKTPLWNETFEERLVTYTQEIGGRFVIIEHVPSRVCRETGEQLLVDTSHAKFRQRFAQIAAQRETELRQTLSRAGVDTLELSTADDLVQSILRFTDMRKRRSRIGAGGKLPAHLKLVA